MLAGAGLVQLTLVLPYRLPLYLTGALLLGFCAQGLKICVDTIVQRHIDDEFRGRVFALYDTVFNVAVVTAAVMVALVLPSDGYSPISVVVIGLAYLTTAVVYTRLTGTDTTLSRPAAEPTSV
jgi:MFS family permease